MALEDGVSCNNNNNKNLSTKKNLSVVDVLNILAFGVLQDNTTR
jgi:hypothetical protein